MLPLCSERWPSRTIAAGCACSTSARVTASSPSSWSAAARRWWRSITSPRPKAASLWPELLGSRVTYLQRNLYELDAAELGTFDIVLFLGLLYHLPDPLGALRVVRNLTRQRMLLETLVLDFGGEMDELPMMRFFAGSSWAGDPTNYWGPNVRCVEDMLGETEFAARRVIRIGDRGIFDCEAIASPAAAYYMQIATGRRAPG
jgi:hypothetical protein